MLHKRKKRVSQDKKEKEIVLLQMCSEFSNVYDFMHLYGIIVR